jgi:hypothetical protein
MRGRRHGAASSIAVVVAIVVVLLAAAAVLVSRTQGSGSSRNAMSGLPSSQSGQPSPNTQGSIVSTTSYGPSLEVGDYAQFTGNGSVGAMSENETARFQVVAINSSGVEWMQSSTINGQNSVVVWVVPAGVSPFHFAHANDTFVLVKSFAGLRKIGSQDYQDSIFVYTENGIDTNTYYYIEGTGLIPIEFTGQTNSGVTPAITESFYLTVTNIPGLTTVNPTQ